MIVYQMRPGSDKTCRRNAGECKTTEKYLGFAFLADLVFYRGFHVGADCNFF